MKHIEIWTDGACIGNPGKGGWGAIMLFTTSNGETVEREMAGSEFRTTNNRMEMAACIEALEALKEPCAVTLKTDSQYVQKGMSEWLKGWKRGAKTVKNVDLWRRLDALASLHTITWVHVRAHVGIELNERCDRLACAAAEAATPADVSGYALTCAIEARW